MIALVCFLLGSLRGANAETMLLREPRMDLPGSAMARANLRLNRRSSTKSHTGWFVLAVNWTAMIPTAIPPMMSTIQWIPR